MTLPRSSAVPSPVGYVSLVLHAHMPYVRHSDRAGVLEEAWLYEAITECYLPLLDKLERLADEGVPYRLTLSVSPPLMGMLADPLVQARYRRYVEGLIALADREVRRTRSSPDFQRLARFYLGFFKRSLLLYDKRYDGDLISPLRRLADANYLELITTAATHAYLPLLVDYPEAVRAQLMLGIQTHRRALQRLPHGFWLPECGFFPGVDSLLAEYGSTYFFLERHGIIHARPRPRFAVYAPVRSPAGPAAFGRNSEAAAQVWDATQGYPGDPAYREFYRDIGFELPPHELGNWWGAGQRAYTGIKYYRITGHGTKKPYCPQAAHRKAAEHAQHFVDSQCTQMASVARHMDRPPLVVAPYDCELFGHWWYEGPVWLERVLRILSRPNSPVRLATPSEYLQRHRFLQPAMPASSSWGEGGYHKVWLNQKNEWTWRQVEKALRRMRTLAARFPSAAGLRRRALNQAARELLLAQSSDWAFLIKVGTTYEYATQRIQAHLAHFHQLCEQVETSRIQPENLWRLEWANNLFPDLDYRVFAPQQRNLRHEHFNAAAGGSHRFLNPR